MSDTERSLIDLIALCPDNTAGSISEQDLRDILVSIFGSYGSVYIDAGSGTQTLTLADTAYAMAQFTSVGPSSSVTALTSSITVGPAGVYDVDCRCEFVGAATRTYTLTCGGGLISSTTVNSNGDRTALAFSGQVTLAANAALALTVQCGAAGQTFAVKTGHWKVKRIG
jgi:hypothetical protein